IYYYSTSATDPDGDDVYYQFDWGDNTISSWLGPYPSGQLIQASKSWSAPGGYQLKASAKDVDGKQSGWSLPLSIEMKNRAPAQPGIVSPQNGASSIQTNANLSWTGSDPDGDIVTYDVFFGISNPPAKIVDNQSAFSFHPGTLQYLTTYYWKIIAWDPFGGNTSSPAWSFTTKTSDDSSGQQNNDTTENNPPVANISLSEPFGFVDAALVFNGSMSFDSDGYLTKWSWNFDDGTTGSGEVITHIYQNVGSYTVTLSVTDDKSATGTDSVKVKITTANRPPTKPRINGTTIGTKNKTYLYSVQSTDPENDFLQYIVAWGDRSSNTSDFLPNGTYCSLLHSWSSPGKYTITAKATDNATLSEMTSLDVFIDVFFVNTLGFLFDSNSDGLNDSFYINSTGDISSAQKLTNGSYLLDTNGDGSWNYLYNPTTGSLGTIQTGVTTIENRWFFIVIIVVAFAIIACIVYLYKKNYF
ncbi:MAG TPA: hypothetical protein DSN98_06380, partial [Thermoplasmata archaeon]